MISFRYHVVTLVAVFMALAVGVLFGATFISQNIVDGLEASQQRLGDRNESLRGLIVELEGDLDAMRAFTASTRDAILRDALPEVPVVLLSFESTPAETLDAVRAAMISSGAEMSGHLRLSNAAELGSEEDLERLAALLSSASSSAESLSAELVDQLGGVLDGDNPGLLRGLAESGLAAAIQPLAALPAGVNPVVVMLAGDVPGDLRDRVALPLARTLSDRLRVTAVVDLTVDGSMVVAVREDSDLRAVTVDSVTTPMGQAALGVGLKAALSGQYGHYGRGEGATTVLPPV